MSTEERPLNIMCSRQSRFPVYAELMLLLSLALIRTASRAFSIYSLVEGSIALCTVYLTVTMPSERSQMFLGVSRFSDNVGLSCAALLPLAAPSVLKIERLHTIYAASTAVALAVGFAPLSIAVFFAATGTMQGRLVDIPFAACLPIVTHGLLSWAPNAFSLAEACLVSSLTIGLVYYAFTGLRFITVTALLGAVLISYLLLPIALYSSRKNVFRNVGMAFSLVLALSYLHAYVVVFESEPVLSLVRYVFGSKIRMYLIAYWLLALNAVIFVTPPHSWCVNRNFARKLFHYLALAMFLPGVYFEPAFTAFAQAVALAVMLLIEVVRVADICHLSRAIERYTTALRDSRDSGPFILSHVYLLLGNALPLWLCMFYGRDVRGLLAVSGIISLDVLDSTASIMGTEFGQLKWRGSDKTVEGTVIAAMVSATFANSWVLLTGTVGSMLETRTIIFATIVTSLFEAWTSHIDNLVLPVCYFIALELI